MKRINLLKYNIFGILLLFQAFTVKGTRIEGFEPDYAGRTIEFFAWTDLVSKQEKPAFSLRIGPQGRIQVETGITETLYCFAEFDSYRGKIIISPGETLKIKLPPLQEKTFEESKNPYFKPIELWIMSQRGNQEDLTTLYARFDQQFYFLQEKYFNQLFFRQQRNYLDSLSIPLEKAFASFHQPEFSYHRQLQLKTVEAGMLRSGREKLMGSLNQLPVSAWQLPAFAELVDRLLTNTLSQESKTTRGSEIRSMVARRNFAELKKWTESFTGTVSPLSDLVLIKLLHDAYYSGDFQKNAILELLQSPAFRENRTPEIRTAASEVTKKLRFLNPGTIAPVICLPTLAGETHCSDTFEKPYQYILFVDLEIPVCREQVKYLTEINERMSSRVDILLVLTPSAMIDYADFIAANGIPGKVIIDDQMRTAGKTYRIRSYPSALLINKNHQVVLAPAKSPLDGFEHQISGMKP